MWHRGGSGIGALEGATSVVEGAELNRDTSTDTDERSQCALVECWSAFIFENLRCAVESSAVIRCGLKANFDDI